MGANEFENFVRNTPDIATAGKAFSHAHEKACYNHGHGGYTGTIAEKEGFEIIAREKRPTLQLVEAMTTWGFLDPKKAGIVLNWDHDSADDKWGPAVCVEVKAEETGEIFGWMFFGWASS